MQQICQTCKKAFNAGNQTKSVSNKPASLGLMNRLTCKTCNVLEPTVIHNFEDLEKTQVDHDLLEATFKEIDLDKTQKRAFRILPNPLIDPVYTNKKTQKKKKPNWLKIITGGLLLILLCFSPFLLPQRNIGKTALRPSIEKHISQTFKKHMGGPLQDILLQEQSLSFKDIVLPNQSVENLLDLPSLKTLSSGYGVRLDSFEKKMAFHAGIDFDKPMGSNVNSALDGKVVHASRYGKYGNLIRIKHHKHYETRYAHLSKIKVKVGQIVKKGDLIGLVGSTGRSTGPHLHFELLHQGKKINPLTAQIKH